MRMLKVQKWNLTKVTQKVLNKNNLIEKKNYLLEFKFCRESVGDEKLSRHVRERSHYSNVGIIVSFLQNLRIYPPPRQ